MNNIPFVTKNLLIINVLMFLASFVAQTYGIDLADYLGLHFILADRFNPLQLLTYMFMHAGFQHLFFNMFALWMFGRVLEQVWGSRRFLIYFLVCGAGAGLVQELVTSLAYFHYSSALSGLEVSEVLKHGAAALQSHQNYVNEVMAQFNLTLNSSTVGASGAVYAILLGFGMTFPNERMMVFPLPMPIKAKYFVMGYAVIELWAGLSNNPADNVAHFAHLGGMIFGFLFILFWRKSNRHYGYYNY